MGFSLILYFLILHLFQSYLCGVCVCGVYMHNPEIDAKYPQLFSPCFLRQGLSPNLELTDSTSQPGQRALGIQLSLPPQSAGPDFLCRCWVSGLHAYITSISPTDPSPRPVVSDTGSHVTQAGPEHCR